MKLHKTVTTAKVEANRRNSRHSTGPKTGRGKRNVKFNAVTLGLFAKHVVIPICDGYKAEKDFQALLDGLYHEFQPVGFYEEWLVVKIGECMWRLRRATRCESGSVREAAIWDRYRGDDERTQELAIEISALTEAEEQIQNTGTLSQKIYEEVVAPLVEQQKQEANQAENDDIYVETEFDGELFLASITNRRELLESDYASLGRIEQKRSDARFDHDSLLPGGDMDRILRYEERMHRQIDWAVQRFLEAQERRKTVLCDPDPAFPTKSQNGKRSQ